jgi:endonuclease/exonuclease/phosphatase family metal-dependent hydrolase
VFFQHRQLLKCATYNTFSCSPAHSPHQTRALLSIIHNLNADIISLQEVSVAFYRALMEQEGTGEYYASSLERYFEVAGLGVGGKGGKQGGREGVVMLVKKELVGRGSEVRMVMMESARGEGGKALLVLKLVHEGEEKVR